MDRSAIRSVIRDAPSEGSRNLENEDHAFGARGGRMRRARLVVCALVLFAAGLLLLFAPGPGAEDHSRVQPVHCPCGEDGWIMGAQSLQPGFVAGG